MDEMKIKLSALWVALMLIYLLGDVLRIMSGDPVTPGEIQGEKVGQWVWLGMAVMMLIPIAMVILSVFLNYPVNRWANIIVAIIVVVFNVISLPYPSVFDNFLIFVSIGVNALTIWLAWKWV